MTTLVGTSQRGQEKAMAVRIALVGIGAIGSYLLERIAAGATPGVTVVTIADLPEQASRLRVLAERHGCAFVTNPKEATDSRPDLVLEAASQAVVREAAGSWLEAGVDVLLMSVGALADPALLDQLTKTARETGRRVYLPSGAVGGLDVIRAARQDRLDEVSLTTTKPPRGLAGAPYLVERGIDVLAIRERTVLFEGVASEAVKAFPANLNVVAALSLAGLGSERTRVTVVADPEATVNTHEVVARGSFGALRLRLDNLPSPDNPRTSQLACLSALALLRRLSDPIQLGS